MRDFGRKAVINMAKKVAITQANTSCAFWFYQPKMPKALEKLRKVN
ncbi:cyclic lactone autoinducer peptide [Butyrivibrio sp. YAB3001]